MRSIFMRTFCLYLISAAWGSENFPCEISYNSLSCRKADLSRDVTVDVKPQIYKLSLKTVKGSIGVKTLSPFQEVHELEINFPKVSDIENGALCSLPKLKTLKLRGNTFPILTKKHLNGCGNVENFECYVALEDDVLEEMTELKSLKLSRSDTSFPKAFLAPLVHLESLHLDLERCELEPGLFCLQPTLKELTLYFRSPINITESLFEGCNNLQYIHLSGNPDCVQVPEGQYPFSNMLHLEELIYIDAITNHLTKHFLDGLPNLKIFAFSGNSNKKLNIDRDAFEGAPKINRLRIASASLGDSDLETLHVLSELNRLEVENNNIQDLNSIAALPKLEYIDASYNKISKFNFSAFKEKFPSLKVLLMMDNQFDPAFEEELSNENEIVIRTSYDGIVNKNKTLWDVLEKYPF